MFLATGHADQGAAYVLAGGPRRAFPARAALVALVAGNADRAAAEVPAIVAGDAFLSRATLPMSNAALGHADTGLAALRHPRLVALASLAAGLEAAAAGKAEAGVGVAFSTVSAGPAIAAQLAITAAGAAQAVVVANQAAGVAALPGATRLAAPAAGLADAPFADQAGAITSILGATDQP
jgi:hypothetical protein